MNIPHIPPRKILVPFDFSKASRVAWDMGQALARALGASIEALYVYEIPTYPDSVPVSALSLSEGLRSKLIGDMRRELGPDVQATVLQGLTVESILSSAVERKIDLIVMGTRGHAGVSRLMFNSAAESLSRHSSVPILTLRKSWKPVKTILAPVNFASYSLKGFFAAADLARRLGARFDVLHVADGRRCEPAEQAVFDDLVRELPDYFADKAPRFLCGTGEPARRIVAAGAGYDLVVLVAHRKSMFRDVVLGTTAERVLRHSFTPVLAIPDAEEPALKPRPRRRQAPGGH